MTEITFQQAIEPSPSRNAIERMVALILTLVSTLAMIGFTIREVSAGTPNSSLFVTLTVASVVVASASTFARFRQDSQFAPTWFLVSYLAIAGCIAIAMVSEGWANKQGLGLTPALVPGLCFFVCAVSPLGVSNQTAFGIGSLIPKVVLMAGIMQFTDNSDWGVFSSNHLLSPQSALAALAVFSALISVVFLAAKSKLPSLLMFLIGLIITLPCILKIELPLVVLHLL